MFLTCGIRWSIDTALMSDAPRYRSSIRSYTRFDSKGHVIIRHFCDLWIADIGVRMRMHETGFKFIFGDQNQNKLRKSYLKIFLKRISRDSTIQTIFTFFILQVYLWTMVDYYFITKSSLPTHVMSMPQINTSVYIFL